MELYITGTGIVSGAGNSGDDNFLKEAPSYNTDKLLCIEPDYKAYIPPMQLRRMSKAVRIGIGASKMCMAAAGIEKPDAISVGTAMGCLADTEVFLGKMIAQGEQMLTPTAFIQSTHNTVSGQIALLAGCYGHNLTYVQRGHSFEHAVINTQLYLADNPQQQMLVGGIDELTDGSIEALKIAGINRKENSTPADVLNGNRYGAIAGEGAAFFIMTDAKPATPAVCIKDVYAFTEKDTTHAVRKLTDYINNKSLSIDAVILGQSGDEKSNAFYLSLRSGVFANTSQYAFKHLCGEYATSSAFALGILTNAIAKCEALPSHCALGNEAGKLKNVLIVNHYMHYYSCFVLQIV
ncbi:MAG: beta-ketoacyl synthase chain length factor [Flavipsychrobacter sp.]